MGAFTFDVRAASGVSRTASGVGVSSGGADWTAGVGDSRQSSAGSALGGALQSRCGGEDASRLSATTLEGWRESAGGRWGLHLEGAGVTLEGADVDGLWTSAWSLSAVRQAGSGALRLALAQPRRAEGGALTFLGPVEVLRSGALRFEERTAALAPSGREVDLEVSWSARLAGGADLQLAAALATQPGHVRGADPQLGAYVALRRSS